MGWQTRCWTLSMVKVQYIFSNVCVCARARACVTVVFILFAVGTVQWVPNPWFPVLTFVFHSFNFRTRGHFPEGSNRTCSKFLSLYATHLTLPSLQLHIYTIHLQNVTKLKELLSDIFLLQFSWTAHCWNKVVYFHTVLLLLIFQHFAVEDTPVFVLIVLMQPFVSIKQFQIQFPIVSCITDTEYVRLHIVLYFKLTVQNLEKKYLLHRRSAAVRYIYHTSCHKNNVTVVFYNAQKYMTSALQHDNVLNNILLCLMYWGFYWELH